MKQQLKTHHAILPTLKIKLLKLCYLFLTGLIPCLFQSCDGEEIYSQESMSNKLGTNKVANRINTLEHLINNTPDSAKIVEVIKDLRIDTMSFSYSVKPLFSFRKIKTRREVDETGHRYGVAITQNNTTLNHKIYIIFTEIDNDYTIENVSYTISGLSFGKISTSVSNLSKGTSTSSSFETTATWEIMHEMETLTKVFSYRWNITFNGGSSISFSASPI